MAMMQGMENDMQRMKEEMGKKEETKPMEQKMGEMKGKMTTMKEEMMSDTKANDPKVVNTVCPIMGGKVDPYTIPDNLIREFEGKEIGFCCPGCPAAWDKLSDKEKQEKLKAAMSGSSK